MMRSDLSFSKPRLKERGASQAYDFACPEFIEGSANPGRVRVIQIVRSLLGVCHSGLDPESRNNDVDPESSSG